MDLVKQYVDLDLLSRLISYAIIAGSAIVKLPQIYNVVKAGTAKGLNLNSIYLETLSSLSGTIYNVVMDNPFRTYGETALILVQNIIIVLLFWSKTLKPSLGYQITAASVLVGAGAVLWNVRSLEAGWPKELSENNMSPLDCVCNLGTALLIIARIPQVVQNFQQGHTGVLSVLTLIMNIGGNVARLGTSLREGLAPVVVYSFVLNGSLNLILFAQVLLYWRATDAAIKGGKVGKAATSTPSKGNKTPSATPQSGKSTGKKGKPKAE